MKWIRLGALSALLLSIIAVLMLYLMVKQVPRQEAAWEQSRAEITVGQRVLLKGSHLCQRFLWVLLPGCVGLVVVSATGYVLAVRKGKPSQATTP